MLAADSSASTGSMHVYTGAAAYVLFDQGSTWRAAALTVLNGRPTRGTCRMMFTPGGAAAQCHFTTGDTMLTSSDVYVAGERHWCRTYSDGRTAVFDVPPAAGVIPVPLPLGR